MATPTIKKESFFEYNPVRKKHLSCEFASGFELLCFSMAGRSTSRPETKQLRLRKDFTSYITFSNMIVFEKGFFFNRRGGHGHSSILKFRLVFKGSPTAGRSTGCRGFLTKM